MTRLQKKCLLASAGMHGLLLVILIASSAFRSKPVTRDIPIIMTMVNVPVTDQQGAGGGTPEPVAPTQPRAQPTPQMAVTPPPPQVVHQQPQQHVEPVPQPRPVVQRQPDPTPDPDPQPDTSEEAVLPAPKPRKHTDHKVVPTFDSTPEVSHKKRTKPKVSEADTETASAESNAAAARAATRRLSTQLAAALDTLATGVQTSGAKGTVVDMPGQGGGAAFVGYETAIFNAYYHAWITPDSVADKLAATDAKIVVARDGSILSAEIRTRSGEREMDRSVDRALRAVLRLPPFPSASTDEQRTFVIRFNLEAKQGSG